MSEQNSISVIAASDGVNYLLNDISKSAISVDNIKTDLILQHMSQEDYEQLVFNDKVLSNSLYIVSSDYVETYGQQIKNVAEPTDLSDAVTKGYVDSNFQPAGNYLTAVPDAYKTYVETKSSLSSDGYALQAELDTKSTVSVDNEHADVDILHISQEEYNQLVFDNEVLSNVVYVVSSDYIDAYGQQIKNLAPGTDLSDAVNVQQLSDAISSILQQLNSLEAALYAINNGGNAQ